MSLLELLVLLGQATWQPIWVPVLAWTVLAVPLWSFLQRSDRLHPLAEYRLSQVLLVSLPLGLLAAAGTQLFALGSPSAPLVNLEAPMSRVPSVTQSISVPEGISESSGTGIPWHWTHAVGALTIVASAVTAVRLGQLALKVAAALRVRTSVDATENASAEKEADRLANALGIDRNFRIRFSSEVAVPLTVAGNIPMIILPDGLVARIEARRMALRHELVHVGRYDDVAQLAERALAALFAFHPLVSILCTQIDRARERACDAAVLDDGYASASAYARLLAAFADRSDPNRLGALSLSESPSSLTNRLSAMRSSLPSWFSTTTSRVVTVLVVGIGLPLAVAGCTDLLDASSGSSVEAVSPTLQGDDGVWTPVADAREVADKWVSDLNQGEAQESYKLADPMVGSVSEADWSSWIQQRQSHLGNPTSRRFMYGRANTGLGPPNTPSIMFRYVLQYDSGKSCQPAVIAVLESSSWKIGTYGPPCGSFEFPEKATAATKINTAHELPTPAEGMETFTRVWDEKLADAIGPGKTVIVDFFVDDNGGVSDLQATGRTSAPLPPSLRTAALDAVRSANFEPGRLKGESVPVQMSVPVMFRPPRSQNTQ